MTGAIVGKKEIGSVQDLKGKRLGIDRVGSNPDMFTQAALSRFQMDPLKDLQYIQPLAARVRASRRSRRERLMPSAQARPTIFSPRGWASR